MEVNRIRKCTEHNNISKWRKQCVHFSSAILRAPPIPVCQCAPVSHLIRERRLRFFEHVARADPKQDQHRVIEASLRPPSHWRRPCGRLHTSWPRGLILMYSQSTSGSTLPGETPVTARSDDVSSTRQHSILGHATEEEERTVKKAFCLRSKFICTPSGLIAPVRVTACELRQFWCKTDGRI